MAVQEAYAVVAAICLNGEANYMIGLIEHKAKYNDVIIAEEK